MAVFAVVPVKGLGSSKRRLSAVLNPKERRLLTQAMLEDVLNALKLSVVQEAVVVSVDSAIRQVADKFGVSYLLENKQGLNSAIEKAVERCVRDHATSVIVLPADIPLLASKDINRMVELGSDRKSVVLSPSQDGGTNALFESPPNLIPACFGPKSFVKHVREAHLNGLRVRFYCSAGVVTDVDSAKDLKRLLDIQNSTRSRRFLEQSGFGSDRRNQPYEERQI